MRFKVSYIHSRGYRVSRTFSTREEAQEFIDVNAMICPLPGVRLTETSPDTMFDLLTTDDLYQLHSDLCDDGEAIHASVMDADGNVRVGVFGDKWNRAIQIHSAILDTMILVHAEIDRRKAAGHA